MNISLFISLLEQLRVFHWNTTSYAEHKAFETAYENIEELVDNLVETYSGKYSRIGGKDGEFNIAISDYSTTKGATFSIVNNYIKLVQDIDFTKDADLDNIKLDILNELNHLKYLLTLK